MAERVAGAIVDVIHDEVATSAAVRRSKRTSRCSVPICDAPGFR